MKVYIIKNNTCREIKLPTTASLKCLSVLPMRSIMPGDLSLYILFAGVTGIAYVAYSMYDDYQKAQVKRQIEIRKSVEDELKEWELQKKIDKMRQEKNPQKISNVDCTNVFVEAEKIDCTHIF